MLKLNVLLSESFNDATSEFIPNHYELTLEHSLVSLSKWESFYEVPFLSSNEKTEEQVRKYVEFMAIDPNIPPEVFSQLSEANFNEINRYINAKMTATWFREDPNKRPGGPTLTAETLYHMMIALSIPFECQHWHLTRLITLIRVCNEKNSPPKKMSRQETLAEMRRINEQRRAQHNTTG